MSICTKAGIQSHCACLSVALLVLPLFTTLKAPNPIDQLAYLDNRFEIIKYYYICNNRMWGRRKHQASMAVSFFFKSYSLKINEEIPEFFALNLLARSSNLGPSNSGPSLAAFQTPKYSKDNLEQIFKIVLKA